MQIKSIGIDLGKTTFHLIALGSRSQVVIRKKFSRSQLLVYTGGIKRRESSCFIQYFFRPFASSSSTEARGELAHDCLRVWSDSSCWNSIFPILLVELLP